MVTPNGVGTWGVKMSRDASCEILTFILHQNKKIQLSSIDCRGEENLNELFSKLDLKMENVKKNFATIETLLPLSLKWKISCVQEEKAQFGFYPTLC